jgi:hypothetical protein
MKYGGIRLKFHPLHTFMKINIPVNYIVLQYQHDIEPSL